MEHIDNRIPKGRFVLYKGYDEYECETEQEAIDLSDALNDAPERFTQDWETFLAWARRTGHTIVKYYPE